VEVALELAVLFGACVLISGAAIRLSAVLARQLGVMDRPGGHKQHEVSTPFVGGCGLVAVLVSFPMLLYFFFPGFARFPMRGMLLGGLVIFLTGLADDIWRLGFKPRLMIQALVALTMILIGGVELRSLGELFPGVRVDLGWLAIPFTVFVTIGLINAVNMIDGMDGLSGSISLVSLVLTAVVAHLAGNTGYAIFIVALAGGVAGFLYYNLRYPGNSRARVFLGDNGSMLLGFLFVWLFIALSQDRGRAAVMPPVVALWLFALPLMDTVGIMLRRIWLGKSPFRPDRHHLHHLLLRAGFRTCDVVAFAFVMQFLFGLLGISGMLLGVPDYLMFWLFIAVFAVYFLVIARPWRLVPWLRRLNSSLGLPSVAVRGIFVGYLRKENIQELVGLISAELTHGYDYQLSVHQLGISGTDGRNVYCVVHIPAEGNDQLIGRIQRDAMRIRRRLVRERGIEVRLFLCRATENDPRTSYSRMVGGSSRSGERRGVRTTLIYSMERGRGMNHLIPSDVHGFGLSVPPSCS